MTPLTESQAFAVLENDARLQLALAAGRMGIWEWDATSNLVVWNGSEQSTDRLDRSSTTPEAFFEVVHPEDRSHVEGAFRKAVAEQSSFEAEFRILRSNGEERWLVGRGMALPGADGRTLKMVGVNFDITDRKRTEQARQRAEAALREAHGLIKTITDTATTALFVMDQDGLTTFMNPAAEAMIGLSFAELEGKVLHDLLHHPHPADEPFPMERCCIGKSILTLREVREHEDVFRDRSGRVFPVRCNASPIIEDGDFRGIVLEVRDITEEKRVQQTLRESAQRKDRFLATLGHELRNPLAPILNALHVLRAGGTDAATLDWAMQLIDRQTAQLVRLIDDLLDISRIRLDKLTLRLAPVPIQEILTSAMEASRPAMEEQGHYFKAELPDAPLEVQADAARLAQVVANLLQNAARYSDPGATICLQVQAETDMVRISVRDNGQGIAPDFLPAVFDMYAQAAHPGGSVGDGLGIGLALVKKLVELHQGHIEARSAGLGRGSEFIVRIPRAVAMESSQAQPATSDSAMPAGLSVLVMDDNIDAADSLALALQAAGHRATAAYTAQSALTLAKRLQPEAIVLDIGMPDVDGYEVARRIRSECWGRNTILVALTGWGQDEDRRRALEAGFDHHVTKPAEPLDLIQRLVRAAS